MSERPRDDVRVPATAGEREMLEANLRRGRLVVEWKLRGCDDAALRAARTPGGMTAHGVLRHLENVERWWFRHVFAGEQVEFDWTDDDPDGEFSVDLPIDRLLDDYVAEVASCDAAIAGADLDDLAAAAPPGRDAMSLRWVVLHMIEETSRHLGHLDVLREQADGVTGDLPMVPE